MSMEAVSEREAFRHLQILYTGRDPDNLSVMIDLLVNGIQDEAIVSVHKDSISSHESDGILYATGRLTEFDVERIKELNEINPSIPLAVISPDEENFGKLKRLTNVRIFNLSGYEVEEDVEKLELQLVKFVQDIIDYK